MYFPVPVTSEVRAETSGFVFCPLCQQKPCIILSSVHQEDVYSHEVSTRDDDAVLMMF